MSVTGEIPGIGVYMCVRCGRIVILHDKEDVLPECPECGFGEFHK